MHKLFVFIFNRSCPFLKVFEIPCNGMCMVMLNPKLFFFVVV